jgi:hypothetical protein
VRSRPPAVAVALVGSLLVYAVVAVTQRWWPSAAVAPLVALLLWRRHRRARFTAYVFFSVLAARGALTGAWTLPAYALVAVGLLQTAAARGAWPRLRPGRVGATTPAVGDPERDDRMRSA